MKIRAWKYELCFVLGAMAVAGSIASPGPNNFSEFLKGALAMAIMLGFAVVIVALVCNKCTDCGKWYAMERTGEKIESQRESKCKYCGHTTWDDPRAG